MKQDDKGLVIRGLLLLALIGVLVTFVLTILFWRPAAPLPIEKERPEPYVSLALVPPLAPYPAGIPWYALYQMGETLPSAPGWDIRYNAAVALARRGSASTPWPLIREMLDEKQQMRNHRVRQPDGREVYDEAAARAFMISALKAVAVWHDKRKEEGKTELPTEMPVIYAQVDRLAQSEFMEMKVQAQRARSAAEELRLTTTAKTWK